MITGHVENRLIRYSGIASLALEFGLRCGTLGTYTGNCLKFYGYIKI